MAEHENKNEYQKLFINTIEESGTQITNEALDWLFKYGYVAQERGLIIRIRDIELSNPAIQLSFRGEEFFLKQTNKMGTGSGMTIRKFDKCELRSFKDREYGIIFTREDGSSLFINERGEYHYQDVVKPS